MTLKPAIDRARRLYEKHGHDFQKDLDDHLAHGFVVALPSCFAMATAIKSDGREIDTWFVKVAAGDLRQLVRLIPVPLPFIAFCRDGRPKTMRIYRTSRVKNLAAYVPSVPLVT